MEESDTMDQETSPERLLEEFKWQGERISSEIRKLQVLSESPQLDSLAVMEDIFEVCQRIEANMTDTKDMLNRGMSLIFWVQLGTLVVLTATAVGLLLL